MIVSLILASWRKILHRLSSLLTSHSCFYDTSQNIIKWPDIFDPRWPSSLFFKPFAKSASSLLGFHDRSIRARINKFFMEYAGTMSCHCVPVGTEYRV